MLKICNLQFLITNENFPTQLSLYDIKVVNKGSTYHELVSFRNELPFRWQRWWGRDLPVGLADSASWRVVVIQCIGVMFLWGTVVFFRWYWVAPSWKSASRLPGWRWSFTRGCWEGSITRLEDRHRDVNNLLLHTTV